jgi:chorismate mutase-like protein
MSKSTNRAAGGEQIPVDVAERMKALRDEIDSLDIQIVLLLNQRATCALGIGRLKDSVGLETYQPGREVEVLEHARQANDGPLEAAAITRLFERIIDENRRLERLAEK